MSGLSHTDNAYVLISGGTISPAAPRYPKLKAKNTHAQSDTKSQLRSFAVYLHSLLVSN